MKKNTLICRMLIAAILLAFTFALSVSAREEEPDPNDLSLYMEEDIYDVQKEFPGAEVVPARGFSLFMQLGGETKDGMVEAGMTASDNGIIRSVQVNSSDSDYNIFNIYCGMYLCDAVDIILDCHYTLDTSEKTSDGGYSDTYNSYMDLYSLHLTTDAQTKVTSIFLQKNP